MGAIPFDLHIVSYVLRLMVEIGQVPFQSAATEGDISSL